MIKKSANLFSWLFHPLFMPTFFVLTLISPFNSSWNGMEFKFKAFLLGFTFLITAFLPALSAWWLLKTNRISSVFMSDKKQRFYPFLITAICNGAFTYKIFQAGMPYYLVMPFLGITGSIAILTFITLKFKISAHMTGMGGIVAIFLISPLFYATISPILLPLSILIAGIVGTSRLILEEHTLVEIASGFLLGFSCLFVSLTLSILNNI